MTTKIIAVANQKGGVGKTTTCRNLGAALSRLGKKVAIVDFDPQGHIAKFFGYRVSEEKSISPSLTNIITGKNISVSDISEIIIHHEKENLDILPSHISLAGVEMTLVGANDRDFVLSDYLENLKGQYDYILIDCAPSLGLLTVNALVACNSVLITVQADETAVDGLQELLKSIRLVKQPRKNPNLEIMGILLTMVDERTNYSKDVEQAVRKAYSSDIRIFDATIPYAVALKESNSARESLGLYAPKSKVAMAYEDFAQEVLA